ncbi:MAG: hypothetical protein NTY53_10425 [Kiritimatiellaeota bacterium]|nr:hypothetical protein [Kiritimatiellota bacterium]
MQYMHIILRGCVTVVAVILIFLAWLISQAHGCRLQSWWIEYPLLVSALLVQLRGVRRAASFSQLVVGSVAILFCVVGVLFAYQEWLHSRYFPMWLLFPAAPPMSSQ